MSFGSFGVKNPIVKFDKETNTGTVSFNVADKSQDSFVSKGRVLQGRMEADIVPAKMKNAFTYDLDKAGVTIGHITQDTYSSGGKIIKSKPFVYIDGVPDTQVAKFVKKLSKYLK